MSIRRGSGWGRRVGPAAGLCAALLAGCTGDPSPAPARTASPSPAELAHRPLALPTAAPGGRCPVTSAFPRPKAPAHSRETLGDGPLGPVASYFHPGAILQLRPTDRDDSGWYAVKVRWSAFDYAGPVRIRAGRIDAPGPARAEFAYTGRAASDGFTAEVEARDGYQDFPAVTYVREPGCYAYQVDTTDGSRTIVFAAARER